MGEKALKALLAADDRDLRSHSPNRYPDALGDELPADVFGPEDGAAALEAASELFAWAWAQLP
ncbi:MAG: hypothetical protein FJ083_10640 [Cyanobacteria bacterium K_Offshore_surface_m2_239]|nr:hypothetical protein [Cyanobacteria bacterium K_Offshore_surface_m2_239]